MRVGALTPSGPVSCGEAGPFVVVGFSGGGYDHRVLEHFDIVHLPRTDSTQAEARRRVEAGSGAPGLVLVADEQTEGRGRRGRAWTTFPGHSLAVTAILPAVRTPRPGALLLLAAVAGARALEAAGSRPIAIKWPNDLYAEDRKLGGLLADHLRAPTGECLLLGWGVNLSSLPEPLPAPLTRIAGDAGLPPGAATRERVLTGFLEELRAALAELTRGEDGPRRAEFCRRSWLDGREVEIQGGGRRQRAVVERVTSDGDVVLADGRQLLGEHVEAIVPVDASR